MLKFSKHGFCVVLTAVAMLSMASSRSLAENFTYVGGVGSQLWEVDGNWNGDAFEVVDKYPGQTLTTDTALLNVPLAGSLSIDITAPRQVNILSIGDTDGTPNTTTITGSGTGTLTATAINTLGTAGAVNNINVPYLLKNSVTINTGGTNALTINGNITNNAPGVNAFKDIRNDSGQTLTINGNVILSDSATANGGDVRFRQGTDTTTMFINGVISNGPNLGGQVNYARGIYHIVSANTYTGTTQLGENSPNNPSTNIIYTDTAFGSGVLLSSGGTAIKSIEGAAGFGTRTLANEIQLARELRFAGTESITLNGQISQPSSRGITNDISGTGKILSINGNVFTDRAATDTPTVINAGRKIIFTGSGRTEISGVIDDKFNTTTNSADATATRGNVRQAGAGTVVYMNNSVAAYGQATEVYSGTLQLGTGGAAVNLNGHSVQGTTAGGGTLVINHSGSMTFDTSLGYSLAVTHSGSGTTDFTDNSFGTGTITVSNGKVLINGGNFAGSAVVGATRTPDASGNTAIMTLPGGTAGLHTGQPISGTQTAGTATTFPADAYVAEILDSTRILLSGNLANASTWNLTFGAGTGTGTANVVVGPTGILGGSGVVGGFVGVNGTLAPGNSVGTLTVNSQVILNSASTLAMELLGTNTAVGGAINDLLVVGTALTLDGTLNVSETVAGSFLSAAAGDKWRLINYSGSLTDNVLALGSLPSLSAGLLYQIETSVAGQVNLVVAAIPEANACIAMGLVTIGSSLVVFIRKRRAPRTEA